MRINYNIPANLANNKLNFNNNKLAESIERLSSGLKINSAADDAAGMSIAKKINAQIKGLAQANNNAEDGVSVVNTVDGAMGEIQAILQRMNELCIQSANGINASADRTYIQTEVDQMIEEIDRIANTTQFNAQNLLDGTFALKGYTNSENVRVFAYSDYVSTGEYKIDSVSYSYYVNTVVDKDNKETKKEEYEINDVDAVKASLGDGFPSGCRVTADDEIITIKGDENFEIQLAVNNRDALVSADTATGATMSSTTTSVSYYTTKTYSNIAIIDDTNNIRYNLSELKIKQDTDSDGNPISGTVVDDTNFFYLTQELVEAGAISDARAVKGVEYQYNADNPRVEITLDNGDTVNYKLDYSLQEKLAEYGNYEEDDVSSYVDAGTEYEVYINGSTTVSYTVPKTEILDPLDNYLTETTHTEKFDFQVGTAGDDTDSITLNITNMGGMRLQVGANEGQVIEIVIPSLGTKYMGVDDLDLSTEDSATEGIDKVTEAINYVSKVRSKIGAYENRLEHTITNLDTTEENITGAYSRIMDVDMSEEMTLYSTYNILVQSSTSMLSHANEAPQSVLRLLQ